MGTCNKNASLQVGKSFPDLELSIQARVTLNDAPLNQGAAAFPL